MRTDTVTPTTFLLGTLHPTGCPLCGHKPAKRKAQPTAEADTATMTEAELFAYYKRTANVEDCRFALKYALPMSDELRAEWLELASIAGQLSRAECRKRLTALQVRRWNWLDATQPSAISRAFLTRMS